MNKEGKMNNRENLIKYPKLNTDKFGELVRQWRKLCNLTQEEFADYVGMARTTIVAVEKKCDTSELSMDELYHLYYYFAKSCENVFDGFYVNMVESIKSNIDEELSTRMKKRIEEKQMMINMNMKMDKIIIGRNMEIKNRVAKN